MRVSEKALVLQCIKHGDKKYLLKVFSQGHGMLTVSVRAGNSKKSTTRTSSFMPLNFVEMELVARQNHDIHVATELVVYKNFAGIHQDLNRLSIAQFLLEVLIKSLREQHGHPELYQFIEESFDFLNSGGEGHSNLHLYFLKEWSRYNGFEPQNNYGREDVFFDFREGRFTAVALVWPLGMGAEDSKQFSTALKEDLLHAKFTRKEKQFLLEIFLNYFAFHIPGFGNLKSPEVLKELFEDQ